MEAQIDEARKFARSQKWQGIETQFPISGILGYVCNQPETTGIETRSSAHRKGAWFATSQKQQGIETGS